jgi:hypothetical protein
VESVGVTGGEPRAVGGVLPAFSEDLRPLLLLDREGRGGCGLPCGEVLLRVGLLLGLRR